MIFFILNCALGQDKSILLLDDQFFYVDMVGRGQTWLMGIISGISGLA
jgi:hypothetical protein